MTSMLSNVSYGLYRDNRLHRELASLASLHVLSYIWLVSYFKCKYNKNYHGYGKPCTVSPFKDFDMPRSNL